jgi:hypothetical protein
VVARLGAPSLSPAIRALRLGFDTVSCLLVAEDDDSLTVARGSRPSPAPEAGSLSLVDREPWSRALGKPLLWSWSMTNQ